MGMLSIHILLIIMEILAIQVGLGTVFLSKLLIILHVLYIYNMLLEENTFLAYHGKPEMSRFF